jgi:hypothetical protein
MCVYIHNIFIHDEKVGRREGNEEENKKRRQKRRR